MRVRLLSDREEAIVRAYVESGEKRVGFAVVKHRFLKSKFDVRVPRYQALMLQEFKNKLGVPKTRHVYKQIGENERNKHYRCEICGIEMWGNLGMVLCGADCQDECHFCKTKLEAET